MAFPLANDARQVFIGGVWREGADEPWEAHAADAFAAMTEGQGKGKASSADAVIVVDLRAWPRTRHDEDRVAIFDHSRGPAAKALKGRFDSIPRLAPKWFIFICMGQNALNMRQNQFISAGFIADIYPRQLPGQRRAGFIDG